MKTTVKIAICAIIVIFAILGIVLWNIHGEKNSTELRYQLDAKYNTNDIQVWKNQKIELYKCMYHEKTKTGLCIFRAEHENNSVENFGNLISVKGTGCIDVASEKTEGIEYIYLKFSLEHFKEGFENLVVFYLGEEEIAHFELENTVDELKSPATEECEVIVSPVSILISIQDIQDVELEYDDGTKVSVIQNGRCINGTKQLVQNTCSTLFLFEEFYELEGLRDVVVDGEKVSVN